MKRPIVLILAVALVAACQPIQPAPAEPAPAAVMAEAQLVEFPTAGVTVAVPAGWSANYEPYEQVLILSSGDLSEAGANLQYEAEMWAYLTDEPVLIVHFRNVPRPPTGDDEAGKALLARFRSQADSDYTLNTLGTTTVVEAPVAITAGGQQVVKAVLRGTDPALQQEYLAHVWLVQNGGQAVFVSCPLVSQNEAEFLPQCEKLVESMAVSAPRAAREAPLVSQGEIAPGQVVTGTLPLPPMGEIAAHYWHFGGQPGKIYTVLFFPLDPGIDLVGALVDAEGKKLAEQDYGGGGATETLRFTVQDGGDFYIKVRSYFLDPGPYRIEMKPLP